MGNPRKEILLIPADKPVLKKISGRIGTDTNIRWIYLGNDTIRFRAARDAIRALE